jgi:hypothetical protein
VKVLPLKLHKWIELAVGQSVLPGISRDVLFL